MSQASRRPGVSRRSFFRMATVGAAGLSNLGWLGQLAAHADELRAARKACILIWMSGGPSQLDTFDPKPDAPHDGKSPLGTIKTSVPGVHFTEFFPGLAKRLNRGALIRSMDTVEVDHFRATYQMHTGRPRQAGGTPYPAWGSVLSSKLGDPEAALPNYVLVSNGEPSPGASAGFLGPHHQPLRVGPSGVIANASSFLPDDQFQSQVSLAQTLNAGFLASHDAAPSRAHAATFDRAVRMMSTRKLEAFDVTHEPDGLRDAYGRNDFGDSCIRARRLLEVGVPFVELFYSDWDSHGGIYNILPTMVPPFDQGVSALLDDLRDRGLFDSTLVVLTGEFGRTPHINDYAGRDHYAKAWSNLMFGCGVVGGAVVGKTDATASEVVDRPVNAIDYLATIYTALGIDPESNLYHEGRPIPLVDNQSHLPQPLWDILS